MASRMVKEVPDDQEISDQQGPEVEPPLLPLVSSLDGSLAAHFRGNSGQALKGFSVAGQPEQRENVFRTSDLFNNPVKRIGAALLSVTS